MRASTLCKYIFMHIRMSVPLNEKFSMKPNSLHEVKIVPPPPPSLDTNNLNICGLSIRNCDECLNYGPKCRLYKVWDTIAGREFRKIGHLVTSFYNFAWCYIYVYCFQKTPQTKWGSPLAACMHTIQNGHHP